MLKEFRYQGIKRDNRALVRGSVFDSSKKGASLQIGALSKQHNFTISSIEQKKTYLYSALNKAGAKVKGEVDAFTKDEVLNALKTFNYRNINITPKLLNFQFRPPFQDIVMFIGLASDMLKENMRYDEILKILSTDLQNPTLKNTIKNISQELRQGKDGQTVFEKYADTFGKFTAYMLGLASRSGNMAEIYDSTAKYLERRNEFNKNLRQALVMPSVTIIAMILAIGYYVGKLFPDMIDMFIKFNIELPPMTAATVEVSEFLQAYWLLLLLLMLAPIGALLYWWSKPNGRLWRDKYMIKLPIIGGLIHKMNIEIFFRVFSIVYTGSGNNIEVLQISAEACGNKYMEQQIKLITIPMMLKDGAGLIDAINASGVFTETVISRLNAGSATGSVKKSASQLATYYEKETSYRFKAIINLIDIFTALFITVVMTGLIIVSSESAFIRPKTPGMN